MILGRDRHPASACFDEIDAAVSALTDRVVVFNAHAFPGHVPEGAVVWNTENVPGQVPDPRALWPDHEIWDISAANAARYGAKHVPIGYHPSMERFERRPVEEQDIDVVFTGCMNPRRADVLQQLADRGLKVAHIGPGGPHGAERDAVLARSRLALNMLFYPDGTFPALRVAHLVANRVPVVSEMAPECFDFLETCAYESLVENCVALLGPFFHGTLHVGADRRLAAFKKQPEGHMGDDYTPEPSPEVAKLKAEVERLRAEVQNLRADKRLIVVQRDKAVADCETLGKEIDAARHERDVAYACNRQFCERVNSLAKERDALIDVQIANDTFGGHYLRHYSSTATGPVSRADAVRIVRKRAGLPEREPTT